MGSLKSLTLAVFACVVSIIGGAQAQQPALRLVPLAPCRVADTRNPIGTFGGPSIAAQTSRSFPIPQSACNVPSTARAYSLNITAVPHTNFLGFITVWPSDQPQPVVSMLNDTDGRVKAGAAIVPAATSGGAISVFATDATDAVLDINGYFVDPITNPSALAFFTVPPCRAVDTRYASGSLGPPSLVAWALRSFPILASNCNIPTTAQAYSLNYTAVPKFGVPIGFLSTWPTAVPDAMPVPWVSTLNVPTGAVTANAAIVPAAQNGAISVLATSDSDIVIDINGYFAPSTSPNDLSLYTLHPCRLRDTRENTGLFSAAIPIDTTVFSAASNPCRMIPSAQAVVVNATVVPAPTLGFLTLWPDGQTRPDASALNASDGFITANMAIVPTRGAVIDAYGSEPTQLVLDTTGYFASGTGPAPVVNVITVATSGAGSVNGLDGKINCGAFCNVSYISGSNVILNATAGLGATFTGWSGGGCSGTGSFCSVHLSADTTVTASFSGGASINLNSTTVGANLEVLAVGSLTVAPTSTLQVTLSSSDPSKLLLLPIASDPSGATVGVDRFTANIPAGKGLPGDFGFPGFWIQALASSGTATITVSAPGYQSAVATVALTPSGFVLNGPLGKGANFNASIGSDASLTVSPVQLDGVGNVLSTSQVLRGGPPVSVTVNSASPSVGTILNSAVVQPGAGTSSAVAFHPLTVGSSVLSIIPPSGFTSPASGAQLTATVGVPSIVLNPVSVGFNQQTLGVGQLSQGPTNALNVTVTSSDTTKVLLTTNPTVVGGPSVTLTVGAGATALPPFYIQALASSGTVTLTANASGYCPSGCTGSVALTNSAFILVANGQPMTSLTTSTLSDPTTLTIGLWQLNGTQVFQAGVLRPGVTASVNVSNSNNGTGTLSGSPVAFAGGDSFQSTVTFTPKPTCTTPCTTTVSVTQPTGYANPAIGGGMSVTVNKPNLTLLAPASTIGKNLEVFATGQLDATYPQNLQVTIFTSPPNANVLLSTSPAVQGTTSLTFTVPAGTGQAIYYIQSKADPGTATLTATVKKLDGTDAGYNVTPLPVTLASAGFVISGKNGVGMDVDAKVNSTVGLTITAVVLDPTGAPTALEELLRPGLASYSVALTSSNPSFATVTSPVSVPANTSSGSVTVQTGATSGQTAVISITTPTGFSTPSTGNHLGVVIN